jgi:nucleoside-diphosphate-sugar epimerase
MKILVSGGTGFLGSKVVNSFLNKGHEITVLYRDNNKIIDQNNRNPYYLKYIEINNENNLKDYDAIFYCATNYSYIKGGIIELLDANLILPLELLKIANKNSIKYFINIDTIIDKNVNEYSTSKSSLRYWIKKFDGSINIVNIRIDHFFGPGDKSFKFINNIIISLLNNKKSIDLTSGDQERSFIYIDDVVNAISLIIENLDNQNSYKEYNISGKESYSIKYIVERIKYLINNNTTQLLWGKLPYRENETFKTKCNLSEINSIGWKQDTDLDSGLKKTINYYKK